jgi:hypothetical protein
VLNAKLHDSLVDLTTALKFSATHKPNGLTDTCSRDPPPLKKKTLPTHLELTYDSGRGGGELRGS